jgi:hypothetical protein
VKFKCKKKRSYQGFIDDGLKLIEEKELTTGLSTNLDLSISGAAGKSSQA